MTLVFTPMQRVWLRLLWACAIAVVIVGSLLPPTSKPMELIGELQVNDKVEHFCAYFVLAFLPALHERQLRVAIIAIAMVLLGIALEFGQLYEANGRMFEVADMVADACGVLAGVLLAWPLRKSTVVS